MQNIKVSLFCLANLPRDSQPPPPTCRPWLIRACQPQLVCYVCTSSHRVSNPNGSHERCPCLPLRYSHLADRQIRDIIDVLQSGILLSKGFCIRGVSCQKSKINTDLPREKISNPDHFCSVVVGIERRKTQLGVRHNLI